MISRDSHVLRSVIKSGAIYGLTFGTLIEISLRLIYALERRMQEGVPLPSDTHIQIASYPFHWWYLPLISFTLLLPASILVHRYLGHYPTSPVWLWQATGFVGVFAFYLSTLINDSLNAQFSTMGEDYWQFAWSMKPELWLVLILSTSVYSLVYGALGTYLTGRSSAGVTRRGQNNAVQRRA